MGKMTAERLCDVTISKTRPFDEKVLNYIRHTYSPDAQVEWARVNIKPWAAPDASKNLITRAARMMVRRVLL